MENAELEGIAASIDKILCRENVAVDPVLSALLSKDSATNEFCVSAEDLVKYPSLAHLTAETVLKSPTATAKRGEAFYPSLKNPRRTLIFRDVAAADEAALQALLRRCPVLQQRGVKEGAAEGDESSPASTVAEEAAALPEDVLEMKFESSALAQVCYVTLASEELAKEAALWLVAQEIEEGRRVRVGIKTEAEWAFVSPPPPIPAPQTVHARRAKQNNFTKSKRKSVRRFPPAAKPVAPPPNVLAALDQFPPLDASLGQQLIRYSPKELRVIRDTVMGALTPDSAVPRDDGSVVAHI